jgi:hypothetical protein
MVDVTVEGDRVVFQVEGFDRFWVFRSRLEIPVAHVLGIEHNPDAVGRWWHGVKVMGASVPGLFAAGTFYYHGDLVFWDVRDPSKTVIVTLDHELYKQVIVEVADPEATVARVRAVIGHGHEGTGHSGGNTDS